MCSEPTTDGHHLVIEIGCGSNGAHPLATPEPSIGVDIDLQALLRAPGGPGQRRSICADARTLPLRSSACDLLVLQAVLHHLTPTDRALGEMARVLRPNGRLHITDGVALSPDEAATLDAELRAAGLPTEPIYGFDLDELANAVTDVGFEVVAVEIGGRSTFATPPFVSRPFSTERFTLIAERAGLSATAIGKHRGWRRLNRLRWPRHSNRS